MKSFKMGLTIFVAVAIAFLTAFGCSGQNTKKMQLCSHPYALCTSARCVPQPGDSNQAICFCDVLEGVSMSTVPCDNLRPSIDKNGIQTVYSTFSYEQAREGKEILKCPGNTSWSWCLNKRCTVDPSDPDTAICLCDVVRTNDDWITFGGDCDLSTCTTAYWSGSTIKDFENGNRFMQKKLELEQLPVKWCQIASQ